MTKIKDRYLQFYFKRKESEWDLSLSTETIFTLVDRHSDPSPILFCGTSNNQVVHHPPSTPPTSNGYLEVSHTKGNREHIGHLPPGTN